MDLTIIRKDGTTYKLSDHSIKTLDFIVDAPNPRHDMKSIDGRDGFIDLGTSFEGRTLTASLYIKAYDSWDFVLRRNELFNIVHGREPFHIIDSREPGKRWLVRSNVFTPEQITDKRGFVEVPLVSSSAYAESIGTTKDELTYDSGVWQYGQNLTLDETSYTHSVTSFSIYNASQVATIDPRYLPLKITYTGPSNNLTIKNETTGDEWAYTGVTDSNDVIILDGVRSTKNGLTIFRDTNHKLITIKPGWNDFLLTGTDGFFEIEFDFRFYYL